METIIALFAFGTIWFWGLWLVIVGLMIWTIESEYMITSIVGAIGIAVLLWFVYDFNVLSYALHHPKMAIAGIGAYFVAGCVWALIKWGFFVQSIMDVSKDFRAQFAGPQELVKQYEDSDYMFASLHKNQATTQFAERKTVEPNSPEHAEALMDAVSNYMSGRGYGSFPPNHAHQKARITYWIGFWPFSLVWWLLNKPIHYISTFIYNRLTGIMSRMTSWIVAANMKS